MIYIERTVTIQKNTASIDEPVYLYKGDRNVDVRFIIKNSPFKLQGGMAITYGQLIIKRPNTSPIFSDVSRFSSGKITFIITKEMIDEIVELGEYIFQIRLFNNEITSRSTLPPVEGGIIIKAPICEDDEYNVVNEAGVNRARLTGSNESIDVFDGEGNYNKTIWKDKDLITDTRLNHIEDALYQINDIKVSIDHTHEQYLTEHQSLDHLATKEEIPTKVSQLTNDSGYLTEHQSLEDYVKTIEMNRALAYKSDLDHTHEEYITEPQLNAKGYLTAIPEEYITESELDAKGYLTEHQSLEGYATESYVDNAIADIDLSGYALKTELPTKVSQLTNDSGYLTAIPEEYITESELEDKGYLTTIPDEYITESELNAKNYLTTIPDEYITESELNTKGYLTAIPNEYITESELNAKGYLTEHQSLEGYATETFVANKIAEAQLDGGDVDLSSYATKTYVDDMLGDIETLLGGI